MNQPPYYPGQQQPGFGYPQPGQQQPYPQQPGQPAQPGFGQAPAPAAPPQYAPGYQPMPQPPQQPGYGYPPGAAYGQPQLPQNMPRAPGGVQAPQADVDSADDEGEFPKCHPAGGQPWLFTLVSASEKPLFHEPGSAQVLVTADILQSPDQNYAPGTRVSIQIKGLYHPTKNNKAQARLKDLLGACTKENTRAQANGQPWPQGHWAGRKQQLLTGQLNGAPFGCTFQLRETKFKPVLLPTFFPVQR